LFDTGPFTPGAITQISGTCSVSFVGGRTDATWSIQHTSYLPNGDFFEDFHSVDLRLTTLAASFLYNVPLGVGRVVTDFAGFLGAFQSMSCTANGNFSTATYCAYGSREKTGLPSIVLNTLDTVAQILGTIGAGWAVTAFYPVIGRPLDITGLCNLPPGQLPAINNTIWQATPDELMQILRASAWYTYCECSPGTPPPVPFPVPVTTPPANIPTQPTFPCDPAQLCIALQDIRQQQYYLSAAVGQVLQLVTVTQRYELPFAYVNGAVHSGLTSEGGFAVPRIVGLLVVVTQVPEGQTALRGNPPYLFDLGWLAILDANGLIAEKRLVQQQFVWLAEGMPTATRFQWSLFGGVEIQVTELYAET
jgi:hypothetical protein